MPDAGGESFLDWWARNASKSAFADMGALDIIAFWKESQRIAGPGAGDGSSDWYGYDWGYLGSGGFAGSPIFWQGWGGGQGAPIYFELGGDYTSKLFGIQAPGGKKAQRRFSRFDGGGWPVKQLGVKGPGGQAFTGGGSNALPPATSLLPLYSGGKPDIRFKPLKITRPALWPDFPGGTRTVMLESTDERQQDPQVLHGDPRLVAANRGPSPSYGTPVADVSGQGDMAAARHAGLQTIFRVVMAPGRKGSAGSKEPGVASPNVVAWNIGATGLGEALAGFVIDNSYAGAPRVARVSRVDGGVFAVGPSGCKHRLGGDGDNNPILPVHLPCEALFSHSDDNPRFDGPLAFNPVDIGAYTEPSGPTYRVDLVWNPVWGYASGGAQFRGGWAWRVQVPMSVTTPSVPPPDGPETPGPKPPPPPPPEPGPKTPSGGGGGPLTPSGPKRPTLMSGTFGPPPRIATDSTRMLDVKDHVAFTAAIGVTATVFRPRQMVAGVPDLAYWLGAGMAEIDHYNQTAPAVLRAEVYGRQGGEGGNSVLSSTGSADFIRTQVSGKSISRGGTANGGIWYMPPEIGLEDIDRGLAADANRPVSQSYFGMGPGVTLGFGLPDIPTGKMKSGIGMTPNAGALDFYSYDSVGVATKVATIDSTGMSLGASSTLPVRVVSAASTQAISNECIVVDTSAALRAVVLPALPADGDIVMIRRNGGNNVSIDRNGKDIDGVAANQTIVTDGITRDLRYDSTTASWWNFGVIG